MRYYLVAGESSGDLHGSNLMKALRKTDPGAEFRFYGGSLMEEAGGKLVKHYRELAFMGIMDVVLHIRTIRKNLRLCYDDIVKYKPDALILIDYPGFNLRIAKNVYKHGIRVYYYIAPKVWASRESRIKIIRKYIHKLFVIIPFEVGYFKEKGIEAEYFGNPLMDSLEDYKKRKGDPESFRKEISPEGKPVIALLSGSRKYEVLRCLPEMVRASIHFSDYQFVIAGVSSLNPFLYEDIIKDTPIKIVYNRTYDLLSVSHAAVVTSGTATLETALFRIPQVVIYKFGNLTYHIGKFFVHVRFFSLVNIIAEREVVKELLQFDLAEKIRSELVRILNDTGYRESILMGYEDISSKIKDAGSSMRIAERIWETIK